jgi:hypothetical protein
MIAALSPPGFAALTWQWNSTVSSHGSEAGRDNDPEFEALVPLSWSGYACEYVDDLAAFRLIVQ